MNQSSNKPSVNIGLRAELKVSEKPINFELKTVGGNHSLFQGTISSQESVKIKDFVNAFDSSLGDSIPDDIEITINELLLILSKEQSSTKLLISLNLGTEINLSSLPLIGKKFSPDQTIAIKDFKLLYASQEFSQIAAIPELPQKDIYQGLGLSALMQFGDRVESLDIAITSDKKYASDKKDASNLSATPSNQDTTNSQSQTQDSEQDSLQTSDNTKWFDLKKNFGPVYFKRVGVQYQNSEVWFLLDASISSAGLTLTLDGLSVGSSIKQFKPKFNLQGIGIEYESKGAVSIGGSFLRTTIDGKDDYSGSVIVKTETFTISAIGSYTTTEEGHPSLFIYGILDKPIGGPSFFFVTGIALGFAYNRSLILPTVDQIPEFPLVKAALNSAKANPEGLIAIQRELQPYIPPKVGQVMLAVGIKFTSFKIIDSFVLLVATFGDRFALDLIGISTLISPPIPPGVDASTLPPPLAQVRFGILARFVPSEGTLKVEGKILPDSYLFDRNCLISGEFAFYSWFKGEHEGDFVLTVGGYHPRFQIPPHYPRVDPIKLNWRISNELTVKGSMYFALTASAIMAGGRLEAVWQSGSKKAWFIANAHFIVAWQPYFYDARIGVNLGASYTFDERILGIPIRKTISVDVGANLHIWGPEFSGTASIDLSIISFTVRFGDRSQKKPKPLTWSEFKTSFLPDDKEVCTIAVESGLLRKMGEGQSEILIVNPKEFSLITNSVIPSTEVIIEKKEEKDKIISETSHTVYYQDQNYDQVLPFMSPYVDETNTIDEIKQFMRDEEISVDDPNKKEELLEKIEEEEYKISIVSKTSKYSKEISNPGISPMNRISSAITSKLTITISREEQIISHKFEYKPILKNLPIGLWGESSEPDLNGEKFLKDALSGFTIKPKKLPKAGKTQSIDRSNLSYDTETVEDVYDWQLFSEFSIFLEKYEEKYDLKLKYFESVKWLDTVEAKENLIIVAKIDNSYYARIFDANKEIVIKNTKLSDQILFGQLDRGKKNKIDFNKELINDDSDEKIKAQLRENVLLGLDYREIEINKEISKSITDPKTIEARKQLLSAFKDLAKEIDNIDLQGFSQDNIEQAFIIPPQLEAVII